MTIEAEASRLIWRSILVGGIVTVLIGAFLTFFPDTAVDLLGWLVALQFIVLGGAFMVGRVIAGSSAGSVIFGIILGALGIWVGLIAFRNPTETIAILTFIIGAGWFISGVVEMFEAIFDGDTPARGWVIVLGILSAVAGLVLLFYPVESAVTLTVFTGIVMLIIGIARVIQSFQVKSTLGV